MKQQEIIILGALVLLLCFLIWKEVRRGQPAHLFLRVFACILAITSLAGLIIPISWKKQITETKEAEGLIFLTPGSPAQIPAEYRQWKRITSDPARSSSDIEWIPDLSLYLSGHPGVSTIHLFGYGMDEQEWKKTDLAAHSFFYHAPAVPAGFVNASWSRTLQRGEPLNVQGIYHNPSREKGKIILSGLGTALDSVTVPGDSTQSFTLTCLPAHQGKTLYELQMTVDGKIRSTEKIPVIITPLLKPRILVLSSSPDFENKFLASWLYENGYPSAIRNTVSRSKYDRQFLNMPVMSLQTITNALLEKTDLIIADDLALSVLSNGEAAAIRGQMNKGMGLIIQADSAASLSGFSRSFSLKKQPVSTVREKTLSWAGGAGKAGPLAAGQWLSIQPDLQAQPLVLDEQRAIIVSSHLAGMGRTVLSTATGTYSWMLSGKEESYAAFWSLLIRNAARPEKKNSNWYQTSPFPSTDAGIDLVLETDEVEPPVIKAGPADLYTTQTPYLSDTWTTTWWPGQTGWQTLSPGDSTGIFVFEKADWQAAKASELISRNILHTGRQTAATPQGSRNEYKTYRVPLFVFFVVFLTACTYLWWERKKTEEQVN